MEGGYHSDSQEELTIAHVAADGRSTFAGLAGVLGVV